MSVVLDSGTAVRLEVLQPDGIVCTAYVRGQVRKRLHLAATRALGIGMLVRLDANGTLLLGEVVATERAEGETLYLVDVEHYLSLTELPLWLRDNLSAVQAAAAGD